MTIPVKKREYVDHEIIDATKPIIKDEDQNKIQQICSDLHISNDQVHIVEKRMRMAIEKGLSKSNHDKSSVKCFPTYVRHLPNGDEEGRFMALDLGGTNFRVLLVELFGSRAKEPVITCKKFAVPAEVMVSKGNSLFEFIAESISVFMHEHKIEKECLPIGFTFSFPCEQTGLDSGKLIKWTKGFNCPDIVGQDVCESLKKAISQRDDIRVDLTALLNDTTGCLLSCAWREPRCRIGLIVGTGCNACYLENLDKVELWDDQKDGPQTVVINTEWGGFGEHGELDFLHTHWDEAVDASSINPGQYLYEKMISGMYMGDIVRHVLLELAEKNLLFGTAVDSSKLKNAGSFTTRHACEVEHDPVGIFDRCRLALAEALGHDAHVPTRDCYTVRFVCEEVSRRACMLLAAGIASLLRKMDYKDVVVAVDGTLFRRHPLFYTMTKKKITQLMGIEYKFDMVQSEDGSGLGAAIIAAVMAKEKGAMEVQADGEPTDKEANVEPVNDV